MKPLLLRQIHSYLGAFIAPSIIFFALTGALQLFSLHEAHGGYAPAAIIEKLARVHKDQVFAPAEHNKPKPEGKQAEDAGKEGGASPAPQQDDDDQMALSTMLLKWFFLVVALGLTASTLFGLWIAFTRPRGKAAALWLVAAGAVIPLVLLVV